MALRERYCFRPFLLLVSWHHWCERNLMTPTLLPRHPAPALTPERNQDTLSPMNGPLPTRIKSIAHTPTLLCWNNLGPTVPNNSTFHPSLIRLHIGRCWLWKLTFGPF